MKKYLEIITEVQEVKVAGEDGIISRVLRFIGSDATRDRDGEVITHDGWDISNYKKNPVFLWAHNYSEPPIGKAIKVIKDKDNGLLFDIEFTPEGLNPKADMIYEMYKNKFLNAVSVGFIPRRDSREYDEATGTVITRKKELLELSGCPVPCNPNALQTNSLKTFGDAMDYNGFMTENINYQNLKRISSLEERIESLEFGEPVIKGPVTYRAEKPTDEGRAWDAAAATKRLSSWAGGPDKDDIDWVKYRRGFAWYVTAEAATLGAYKLPHHDIVDGDIVTVWRGVAASMAALLGSRGGVAVPDADRRAIYNHLVKHYKQFDKEPPEFRTAAEVLITIDRSVYSDLLSISALGGEKTATMGDGLDSALSDFNNLFKKE